MCGSATTGGIAACFQITLGNLVTILLQEEAFEKCWVHSPLRAAARRIAIHQVSLLSHPATVARRLRIDVHNNNDDDNNDNA